MAESYSLQRQINDRLFPYSGCKKAQLRFLLQYAILAPSHYNAQPWKFRLNADDVEILIDTSRIAKVSDPNLRESTISCGASIRMIEVAARYFGNLPLVVFPLESQCDVLARVELLNGHDPSLHDTALFHAIKKRQTNRGWLTEAQLPKSVIDSCQVATQELGVDVAFAHDSNIKQEFASLTASAVRHQLSLPWYRLEFSSWLRSKFSFKPDGITGFGFFQSALPSPITRTTLTWLNRGKQIGDFNRNKIINGSPILAVISTDTDTKESWINTGRVLSQLLLELTNAGLCASYMNQAVQEPEFRDQVKDLFRCTAKPQLVLRIGVGQNVHWTQRIPVDDCLI